MDKKVKKLYEDIMKHTNKDNNCAMLRDAVRSLSAALLNGSAVPHEGKSHKELAAVATMAFLGKRALNKKKFNAAPKTGTIDAGLTGTTTNPDNGLSYLQLPMENWKPLWNTEGMWGSRIYLDHDFSMDPDQKLVKVSFLFASLDESLMNESMWVELISTAEYDKKAGTRLYCAELDNVPNGIDLDKLSTSTFNKETGRHRILIPAEAIMCVFDNEAGQGEAIESNMYRKEGVVPSQPTMH